MAHSSSRAGMYHFRHYEMGYFIISLIVLGVIFGIFAILGATNPAMGGYGGAAAFVLGFIVISFLYSINNSVGRYDVGVVVGIIGGFLFWLINLPNILPFGQAIVNLWSYGQFSGELAAFIFVISMLVLLYEAYANVKRIDLV